MKEKELKKNNLLHIVMISNISFEPYLQSWISKYFYSHNSIVTELYSIPYEEYNTLKYKNMLSKMDLIIVWLDYDTLFPESVTIEDKTIKDIVTLSQKLYYDISDVTQSNIIWFLFEDYYNQGIITTGHGLIKDGLIDKVNIQIYTALREKVSFVNLKHLIAEVGIYAAYDEKNKYRWNAPYSDKMMDNVAKEIHKQYLIEKGISKKCLILDCDNVLWGGILSEDGIENIRLGNSGLGRSYQDFQRFILTLYYHGVILAVCSKNELKDVMTVFREHSGMILREEHIACFQVNWENKPKNICEIANVLNIDLNSIVFIDDSPIEVKAVNSLLPEVFSIQYERDSVYKQLSCFNLKNNIYVENVIKRIKTYKTNQKRKDLEAKYNNYRDYLNALNIKIDIHPVLPIEYNRVAELTQRTNKCTNCKRYTISEIKERVANYDVIMYSISVRDRFSDLGIVGTMEIHKDTLVLFCLSCRALGREIEYRMIQFLTENHKIGKIKFALNGKNDDLKDLLLNEIPDATVMSVD